MQLEITYIIITKTFTTSNQSTLSMYSSRAIHYYHHTNQYVIWSLKQKSDLPKIADILICDISNVVVFIHNKLW